MATGTRLLIHGLEKFRKDRGLTQAEIASKLGVTQSHLSRVISGATHPGIKLTFRIRELLNAVGSQKKDEWVAQVTKAAARGRHSSPPRHPATARRPPQPNLQRPQERLRRDEPARARACASPCR